MTPTRGSRAAADPAVGRRVSRTALVAAYSVPVMVLGQFAWFATVPVLIVLVGVLGATRSTALRSGAILLAIIYAVPYAVWQVRSDPAQSLSQDISPTFVAAIVAVSVVMVVAIHRDRRRPHAPSTGASRPTTERSTMTRKILIAAVSAAAAVLMILTASTGASGTQPAPEPAEHRSQPDLAQAFADAWNTSDQQALPALFTEDATYTDRGVGKVSDGREGVTQWRALTGQLIDDVHVEVVGAFRSGDHIAVETVYSGHIKGAPHGFAVPAASIINLRGNKIVNNTDYYNLADLLQQSELPPTWTPPTAPAS